VVIHHTRKAEADDPLDTVSGSTGLTGSVDGVMVLTRQRGEADAFLYVDGRDLEETKELALTWNAAIASWTIAGDAEEYQLSQQRRDILQVLEEAGEPLGPKAVTKRLEELGYDVKGNTVKQRIWQMSKDGQLINQDRKYAPPNRNLDNFDNHHNPHDSDERTQVT
jgi:hypothetical protein